MIYFKRAVADVVLVSVATIGISVFSHAATAQVGGWQAQADLPIAGSSLASNATPANETSSNATSADATSADATKVSDDTDLPPLAGLEQLNSVSQLSDVKPTDWAFQSLQSLVERYGCIAGYPDKTYRGNRVLSRYEFAAGLNACMDRINELIAAGTAGLVKKEDLLAVQRLQEEFAAELATLRGRVDALESRSATLEKQQFSATTKLSGVVNFVATDVFSGQGDRQITLQQRTRILLSSSFTGKDLLITRIAAGNAVVPNLAGGTQEVVQSTQWYGNFNNRFFLVTSYYLFPVTKGFTALVAANGGLHADYAPTLSPFEDYDAGTTSLSTFALRNPIYRLGGGTGPSFLYQFTPHLAFSAGYLAGAASNPNQSNGLFNGVFSSLSQLTWTPTTNFSLALTYNHGYFPKGTFGFGDNSSTFGLGAYTGTGITNNTLAQFATVANSYGTEFSWKLKPSLILSGWFGLTDVRAIGVGDGTIWTYALTLALPDLGKKGNLGGLIIGAQPYLRGLERIKPANSNDVPITLEVFYKYQITDNIAITPGLLWVKSPNQSADNQDILLGILRTSFTF